MKATVFTSIFAGHDVPQDTLNSIFCRALHYISELPDVRLEFCRAKGYSIHEYITDREGRPDVDCVRVVISAPVKIPSADLIPSLRRMLSFMIGSEFHSAAIDRLDIVPENEDLQKRE